MPDDTAVSCSKMAEPIEMPFQLWAKGTVYCMGSRFPHVKEQFLEERTSHGIPNDTAVSCAKMATPFDMPFGCGLGWAEGSMCYMEARRRHLANAIEPYVWGGNALLCQITLTACYYFEHRVHESENKVIFCVDLHYVAVYCLSLYC